MSNRLRVAVAGAGFASGFHLEGWRRLPTVELVAICDPDERAAQSRARDFGIPRVYQNAADMLEATRPDALDIVSPMATHMALCLLAADYGAAVLCQKPVAPSLREAQTLAREVGGRIRLMVHENWRFRKQYRQIKRWLEEGLIGDVASAVMHVRSSGLVPDENGIRPQLVRQPFCAELERFMINETLIHHLDVLRWLLGPLQVDAARVGYGCSAIRGEDRAAILLAGDGCWAMLDGNCAVPAAYPTVSDRLEIVGSRGVALFEGSRATLVGPREASRSYDLVAGYADSYAAVIEHFVESLATRAPFETELDDNLHTLALVEDAYAKAKPIARTATT